jgi:L-ascorbate metabolism protein UlaG (beta-lactamase superfamily)
VRLIKYTHACVRLEKDGQILVIDPGVYSEVESLAGAGHVLITHEHGDHVDVDQLTAALKVNPDLRIFAPASVAEQLSSLGRAVTAIRVGDTFDAGAFSVHAVGGEHAEIIDGMPGCANIGYIVDEDVYHPGDSVFVPDAPVRTLLVPASGPWLKLREAIELTRAIKPVRAYPIHDAMLSDLGSGNFDRWLEMKGETEYARIPLKGSVDF